MKNTMINHLDPTTLVALTLVVLIFLVLIITLIKNGVDSAIKMWAVFGTVLTAIVSYYFTDKSKEGDIATANDQTAQAQAEAEETKKLAGTALRELADSVRDEIDPLYLALMNGSQSMELAGGHQLLGQDFTGEVVTSASSDAQHETDDLSIMGKASSPDEDSASLGLESVIVTAASRSGSDDPALMELIDSLNPEQRKKLAAQLQGYYDNLQAIESLATDWTPKNDDAKQ